MMFWKMSLGSQVLSCEFDNSFQNIFLNLNHRPLPQSLETISNQDYTCASKQMVSYNKYYDQKDINKVTMLA